MWALRADYRQAINTHIPLGAGNVWSIDYDYRKPAIHKAGAGNTPHSNNGRSCTFFEPQAANIEVVGQYRGWAASPYPLLWPPYVAGG